MGFPGKRAGAGEGWGMGLLLVLFPENEEDSTINVNDNSNTKNHSNFFSLKSLTTTTTTRSSVLHHRNSNLLSRAQSTISICALLLFITLLLFTLSTFETPDSPRRRLSEKSSPISRFGSIWGPKSPTGANPNRSRRPFALQGMGVLFRRGTKSMNDLVICHASEDVGEEELRLFMRLLHRSGLTSRSDVVLIFSTSKPSFDSVIREENDSFLKLVRRYRDSSNATTSSVNPFFDWTQFVEPCRNKSEKEQKEPLWGRKNRVEEEEDAQSTQLSYGSVVGFEAAELDPENSLAAFVVHPRNVHDVPMSLRRWACYQMLLGRVRRNFKHVMLADVKNSAVVRDPLGRIRNKSPDSVRLWTTANHGGRKKSLTPAVVIGGARGIRRLANSVLLEIVRSATRQHKGKYALVSEPALLSQLAKNGFLMKNIELVISTESIPKANSFGKLNSRVILRGGNDHEFDSVIMREICSYEHETYVYQNCLLQNKS